MNKQRFNLILIAALISLLCLSSSVSRAYADDGGAPDDSELAYPDVAQVSGGYYDVFHLLSERRVSIASKMEEDVNKAPSIVSVITADEIEKMGARTLVDVIRTVPGFDILKSATFGPSNISARGMRTIDVENEKIRILIDGHYIAWPVSGNSSLFF